MNFLVIIIISLVVFGFGLKFIYDLGARATELERMSSQQLDERIGSLLCESEKVCLGVDRKTVKRGDIAVFGLKIINVLDSQPFSVIVDLSAGFDKDDNPIDPVNILDYLFYRPNTLQIINLNRNEERNKGIGVEVQKIAVSGTYIFDVAVCYSDGDLINNLPDGDKCGALPSTPRDLYSFKKFYVEVP